MFKVSGKFGIATCSCGGTRASMETHSGWTQPWQLAPPFRSVQCVVIIFDSVHAAFAAFNATFVLDGVFVLCPEPSILRFRG